MKGTPFTVDDYAPEPIALWPENVAAFNLFERVRTQWRTGMAGPTGLDYTAVLAVMARLRLTDDEHEKLFQDLQVLEAAALEAMHTKP